MFISIDHGKRPSDYKIHLAKPNKEIIAVLHEKHNSTLNLRLGNIFELNFSIPYFIENNDLQMVNNPSVEKIKELMYLKLTWGELEEWFLIDNITESSEDNETMNVQAFSIGYEHKRKRISEFSETAINATEFYTEVLRDSPWTIGEIDSSFDLLFRSFDESGTDRFELIKVGAETFGGVILWDTHNKKISLKEPENVGEFKGLIVNYDRLMTSLNKTRTTDEMVTRLYVYGNERISIENKNPTSERYIEDYSYFMQPFTRDVNKNVLTHSHYMSDDLCHALLDNQELREINEPKIKALQTNIESKNTLLSSAMIDLNNAEFTLMTAKGLLDIAKAVNDTALITQRKAEVSSAEITLSNKEIIVKNLNNEIEELQSQIVNLQKAISVRSFTKELIDELEPYIIEKEIEDSRYIDEGELFEFAKDKFAEIREPRVVIETGIEGLMNSVEEQYYWDKLNLGDTMQVKQKRMNINYKSKIIEINVNLDTSDAEVKIANFTENVDNLDKFISILYSSESNSTILNNNKYKWDSVVNVRDEVTQLRESEIDATKKRITAGVNESVEIGDRGIIVTTPSFPNEMIIMQAGVIALSEDGGANWKTSITPRGVVAETVIGKLVASNNLIVTNDSGSMILDGTGLTVDADSIKIMSGGSSPKNIIEDWNNMIIDMDNFADDNVLTPYEKSQISHQWNMISDAHTKLIESFIDNMGVETEENPYPLEYDIYLETYERLRNFLFSDKQSDGYSMLDSSRMQFVSPISSESYRSTLTNYMTAKDDFILVIPMEYTNASIRVLEEGIFLEYVKSDELVASLNLSEEGVRIDGKLLSINSETRFRSDVVMDAGVIKSADNAIVIDLNAGTIDLSRPLTINAVPVATKEDIENIEMTYTPILSNDTANIPTDENGNNGNYYTANTEITIYQQSKDDTSNWTITAEKSTGITGSLSGNKYTVTNMTMDVGYVDLIAKKSGKTLVKRFTLAKAKDGQSGRIPPILSLSSTGQIMTFDSGNNPTPSSQEIQVVAKVNNYEGQVSWKIEKFNGSSLVETTTPAKNAQNTIMINQSIMTGNVTSVRVTAYDLSADSNFSDYITIYKLKESMDGVGIESITEYYLATSQSTGVTNSTTGFTTTIQTMTETNKYLWNYEKIKYTDGTDKNTVPVIIGVHGQKGDMGEDGRSISSITEHYLATSLESGVSRATSGWTTTMQQTDETKKYLWNYETIKWNKEPLTTYVEPVIIGVHGQKGEDGKNSVTGLLTNEAMTLPATASGTVTDFSSANGVFEVFDGTTKVNATAVYSVTYQSNITVSINQSGAYSVSAMTVGASVTQGTATLRAVYNGVTLEKTLNVSKALVGETGSSATSYWITSSVNVIKKDLNNNIYPTRITFTGYQKTGSSNPSIYSGRFIISTSLDGIAYTNVYTSSSNQSSYTYIIPNDINFVRVRFYQSGGTSILLDEQAIPALVGADNLEVGGENLLNDTSKEWQTRTFNTSSSSWAIMPKTTLESLGLSVGDSITFYSEQTTTSSYNSAYRIGVSRGAYLSYVNGETLNSTNTKSIIKIKIEEDMTHLSVQLNLTSSGRTENMDISYRNMKLEKGNIPTAWSASEADVKKYADNVAKAEANLAETQAKAHADGKVTAEEARAIADAKAKLEEAKNHASGLVDNLEIGGANLIINSEDMLQYSYSYAKSSSATQVEMTTEWGFPNATQFKLGGATTSYIAVWTSQYKVSEPMVENQIYTHSLYIKNTGSTTFRVSPNGLIGGKVVNIPVGFSGRISLTGTKRQAYDWYQIHIIPDVLGGEIEFVIGRQQLEKGNKVTNWSANPSDLKIGGRNLLRDSKIIEIKPNTRYIQKWLSEPIKSGEEFTVSIGFREWTTMARDHSEVLVSVRDSKGTGGIGDGVMPVFTVPIGGSKTIKNSFTSESLVFDTILFYSAEINMVPGNEENYYNLKVERGGKATDWTPAPEDIQTEIDNKANQEDLTSVEDSLNKLYTVVNDLDVQTIKDQLAGYQGILSGVEADSEEAKSQLEQILSEENGALSIINTILDEFNQRWTTLDGFIEINGDQTSLSINKGSTNMVIDSDSLTFYSGGTPVATITNQYMKIDRGIFVESVHIGRHQWAPLASNKDHFVLSYVGDAPS